MTAPTPTPPCLGEREAVARTVSKTVTSSLPTAKVLADAIIAEHIEPLRTENQTLRAEVSDHVSYAAGAIADVVRYAALLTKAEDRILTAEAERDAAIARAEEAERGLTFGETTDESVLRNAFATGAQWAEQKFLAEASTLRAELAQAKAQVAEMREALADLIDVFEVKGATVTVRPGRVLQVALANANITLNPEHPHGD